MWLLVLLVAVSVVVTVVARRRGRDERDSVDAQQRRIDALRTAVTRTDTPSTSGSELPPLRAGRGSERRSRRLAGSALLVAAILVAGLSIYALAAGWDTTSPADDDVSTADTRSSSTTTTSSTSTTTTTAPLPTPRILSTEGGTVTVAVPSGPYRLGVTATDPCWTEVTRSDGTVVEAMTLSPDDPLAIEESGALTLRLGNPAAATVTVDDQALTLPPGGGGALELTLVPDA